MRLRQELCHPEYEMLRVLQEQVVVTITLLVFLFDAPNESHVDIPLSALAGAPLSSCTCPQGYSGVLCESRGICDLRCRNGGSCRHREEVARDASGTSLFFECDCVGPYKGLECEVPFVDCPTTGGGDKCLWGGACVLDEGSNAFSNDFKCKCPLGRAGKSCQKGGVVVPEEKFDADNQGVTNRLCFNNSDCKNGGLCVLSHDLRKTAESGVQTMVAQCLCPMGFGGDACELPCTMLACQHGSSCRFAAAEAGVNDSHRHGTYYCDCDDDLFRGRECEIAVAKCPGPGGVECLYGGTCLRSWDGDESGLYTCACPPGRTGSRCEKREPTVSQTLSVSGEGINPTAFVITIVAVALFLVLPATLMIVRRSRPSEAEVQEFGTDLGNSEGEGVTRETTEEGSGKTAGQLPKEGRFV